MNISNLSNQAPPELIASDSAAVRQLILVVTGVLLAIGVLTLWRLGSPLHSQWSGVAAYSHGYLLAGISIWLVLAAWRRARPAFIAPDVRFGIVFLASLACLVLMDLLFLNVPRLYLLPLLFVACAGAVFGKAAAARVATGAFLLYCALPVWAAINSTLQSLTTSAVASFLAISRVPALITGNFVSVPGGTFEIAEGCSGLRYLVVAISLAYVFAFAWLDGWRRRAALIAVVAAVAILCNWVRVYVVILISYLTEMQSSLVEDHIAFGWILFAVFLLPCLWFGRYLQHDAHQNLEDQSRSRPVGLDRRGVVVASIIIALMLLLSRSSLLLVNLIETPDHEVLSLNGLQADAPISEFVWEPQFVGALESRAQIGLESPVEIYLAVYPHQTASQRLIAYSNVFVPVNWVPLRGLRTAVSAGASSFEVLEYEGYVAGQRRLIWGWYSVAGAETTAPISAKLLELRGLFSGRRDAAAVAMSARCGPEDCGLAREALARALEGHVLPQLTEEPS